MEGDRENKEEWNEELVEKEEHKMKMKMKNNYNYVFSYICTIIFRNKINETKPQKNNNIKKMYDGKIFVFKLIENSNRLNTFHIWT